MQTFLTNFLAVEMYEYKSHGVIVMKELTVSEVEFVSGGSRGWVSIVPSGPSGANRQYHSNPDLDNRMFGTDSTKKEKELNPWL